MKMEQHQEQKPMTFWNAVQVVLILGFFCGVMALFIWFIVGPEAYGQEVHPVKVSFKKTVFPPDDPKVIQDTVFQGGLSIMDCQNMVIKGCEIIGELSIQSSYPEHGLRHIKFEDCYIHDATTDRLVMMGGSSISDIVFRKCVIVRCIGGTHIMYFSGGHWKGEYPPIDGIKIIGCEISIGPAGRHAVQFNGRFTNGVIKNNLIRHAQLCGISLIGCQDFEVAGNVIYGNNRGGIVLFDYASHWADRYNYYQTQDDIDKFLSEHQPNQRIDIHHNTIIQGPKQFSIDPWHKDNPAEYNHGAITINNAVHSGFTVTINGEKQDRQFDFPNEDIDIHHNIICTPNLRVIAFEHVHEATHTTFNNNLVYRPPDGKVPYVDNYYDLEEVKDNFFEDPEFLEGWPKYGHVDLCSKPDYDWKLFTTSFNPYTQVGYRHKVGKPLPIKIIQNEKEH